jgi:septin 3/9/12
MNCVLGEPSNRPSLLSPGQSGLGKSTLINTLFKSKISRKSVQPTSEERIPKTIEIKSITHGQHHGGWV